MTQCKLWWTALMRASLTAVLRARSLSLLTKSLVVGYFEILHENS
jgi:hypothetical protein